VAGPGGAWQRGGGVSVPEGVRSRPGARRLAVTGLFALLLLAGPAVVAARQAGAPVTLADYRARLEQALDALERRLPEALAMARAVLAPDGAGVAVRLPGGEVVIAQPLLPAAASEAEALGRLRLARAQLAAAERDDAAARLARLRAVLARHEFAELYRAPSLWERLWEWLRAWLPRLRPGAGGGMSEVVAEGVAWAVATAGGLAVAVVLSYWLHGLLTGIVADAEARRRQAAGEAEPATAAAARRQALALAGAGNYRQAVRQLYLSALLHLEERGVVRADRSLTNREYLAQVRDDPATRAHLQPVVQTFDEVWYGLREPDDDTFRRYQREVDALTERRS
jgi:hypothetical protein